MAHFAELDQNNVVIRVLVVNDEDNSDNMGIEDESIGIAFLKKMFGSNTNWKQTSYTNSMRVRYAGVGYTYNEQLDAFIPPKLYESWVLDPNTANWVSPLGLPPELTQEQIEVESHYVWDEDAYQVDNTKGWTLHIRDISSS